MVTLASVMLVGLLVVVPVGLSVFAWKQEQKWLDEIDERIDELMEENEGHCNCSHCCGKCHKDDKED